MVAARLLTTILIAALAAHSLGAGSAPVRSRHGLVAAQEKIGAAVGVGVLEQGGNALDAAVATAFALAVTFPFAGNIGGGGFLVVRLPNGDAAAYDFRETAPARATPGMFLRNGTYDAALHHESYLAVGVPGSVAGLHLAWREHGSRPWRELVQPAVTLARRGFVVSDALARSLRGVLPDMTPYPASVAQFSKNGRPYEEGDVLRQPDLARTLERIAANGPRGFYEGETARMLAADMAAHGGLITAEDLVAYRAVRRAPVRGTYRGHEIISMPPTSSGGVALIEMLNMLEGDDLARLGHGSAAALHLTAEAMKRAFADRARYIGDPDFNRDMPVSRLLSKEHALSLRRTIDPAKTVASAPTRFEWPAEGQETTHISVVDPQRMAVALTTTLEQGYGVKIVAPGTGFLLNNEMGDFNAAPGLTTADGLIGTEPNLAAPGKRMLSSMTPTIVARGGTLLMVTGSPGGRTIINTVLQTILNVVDFGMNAQEAVDAGRIHHQWLPDRITYERNGISPDTAAELARRGHTMNPTGNMGSAQVIVFNAKENVLEGGTDRRSADGAALPAGAPTRR